MPKNVSLNVRWDHNQVPKGKDTQRGLLIEVRSSADGAETQDSRPPMNLALVIDRSGSMSGARLAAARDAAIKIARQLKKKDRLSIVSYDTSLDVLLDGRKQDRKGREIAETVISQLQPGGCTDLGGGWLTGAKCAARVMESEGLSSANVLVLSDGFANHGVTDPDELARHAHELAVRGVTSSCVGIGSDYSPLQLDAIAEAGRGQLHHSHDPDELADIFLGELGELVNITVRSARLKLTLPDGVKARQLTRYKELSETSEIEVDLGNIAANRTRQVAFMLDVGASFDGENPPSFKATLSWEGEDGLEASLPRDFGLEVVDPERLDPQAKDKAVARRIAELWLARMGYEAMLWNERGHYREAVEVFVNNDVALEALIAELDEKERRRLQEQARKTRNAVADEWSGSGKLLALSMSKKLMRSEQDHSGRRPDDWSDQIGD